MSKVDDGGPAFGGISAWMKEFDSEGKCVGCWPSMSNAGMSLRDYFAAKAMQELTEDAIGRMREKSVQKPPERTGMDDFEWDDGSTTWADGIASEAYIIADAMLAARKAPQ